MELTNFTLFFAASWVLILTPGPDMIYVITRGISQGRKAGVVSAAGVTLGILVHTLFAAFGLAVILQTSALAFMAVKYAGAAYLIYLGIKSLKDSTGFALNRPHATAMTHRKIFIQGMLTNVLNPKIALFFLAFLPQFVNPAASNASLQMACLGSIFAFLGLIFLTLLGFFSGKIGSLLATRRRLADRIRWVTGSLLIGLGLRLALVRDR